MKNDVALNRLARSPLGRSVLEYKLVDAPLIPTYTVMRWLSKRTKAERAALWMSDALRPHIPRVKFFDNQTLDDWYK